MVRSTLMTMITFNGFFVACAAAVVMSIRAPRRRHELFALFGGMLIGFIDLQTDEVQFPILLLLVFGFILGTVEPGKPLRWIVFLSVFVPLTHLGVLIFSPSAGQSLLEVAGSLLSIVPATIGTLVGAVSERMRRKRSSIES